MSLTYGYGAGHSTYSLQSTKQELEYRSEYTSFSGTVEVPASGRAECNVLRAIYLPPLFSLSHCCLCLQ
jgi:hypothetical protein